MVLNILQRVTLLGCQSCTRLLNSNQLSGQVPIEVYSSGVHGRLINLSSNAGLCGVPSMPSCPTSWKGDLLEGGKIGIVLVALVAAIVVVGVVYALVKRRQSREDYNFNLPHQLAGKPRNFDSQIYVNEILEVYKHIYKDGMSICRI